MPSSRLGLPLVAAGLLMAACATRPSTNELAQAIIDAAAEDPATGAVTAEEAICIADEILDAGLSDTSLSGLVEDFDNPSVLETEADEIEGIVAAAAAVCR